MAAGTQANTGQSNTGQSNTGQSNTGQSTTGQSTANDEEAGAQAIQSTSYEAARDELVEIVRRLESGGTTLEESLRLWERGEALVLACQGWLDGARARLDAVRDRDGGNGNAPDGGSPERS
ncbi:MAG: exodeoxyribonuclease VII small subunit [Actinomycetales bacterium]